MTIQDAIRQGTRQLEAAGVPDPRLDAEYLLAGVLNQPRLSVCLNKMEPLPSEAWEAFDSLLRRRATREPLQYILGETPFYGRSFKCDRRALIPRPETELLCELAIAAMPPQGQVLDLCCGTGAIGLTLALECPGSRVTLTDLSSDALALAHENAQRLGADCSFYQGDLFAAVPGKRFHLIVSNPPYIPAAVCEGLQEEVLKEPLMALDGGADGLNFYRRIALEAPVHLLPGGWLMLEIGYDQGETVPSLLEERFTQIQLHHDLNRLPRMVTAQLKP
ncbi:MAG: peptide chain release factor N(5)-glutamine methyltransferase [Clostridia bacterium]|nr:peptide chain release factor N(5)-glutamine methyltransferase [Clostridia bacterium]